jgi:hypothetical protein
MMQILSLFDMYFDTVVAFVTNSSLLFNLAMAQLRQTWNFVFCPSESMFVLLSCDPVANAACAIGLLQYGNTGCGVFERGIQN